MAVMGGNTSGGSGYGLQQKVRFEAIGEAWNLFQKDMGTWILATFIALAGGTVVFLIITSVMGTILRLSFSLSPGRLGEQADMGLSVSFLFILLINIVITIVLYMILTGGMYRMAIKQARGETIAINDLFSTVDVVLPLIGASILVALATAVGYIFCVIPGLIVAGLSMLTIPIIVDQRCGSIEAISRSWGALQGELLLATVFYFVAGLIGSAGGILCGIGVLFTHPLMVLSIAIIYNNAFCGQDVVTPIDPQSPAPQTPSNTQ